MSDNLKTAIRRTAKCFHKTLRGHGPGFPYTRILDEVAKVAGFQGWHQASRAHQIPARSPFSAETPLYIRLEAIATHLKATGAIYDDVSAKYIALRVQVTLAPDLVIFEDHPHFRLL